MRARALAESVDAGEGVDVLVAGIETLRVAHTVLAADCGELAVAAGDGVRILPVDAGIVGDSLRALDACGEVILLDDVVRARHRQPQGAAERRTEEAAAGEAEAGVVKRRASGGAGHRADVVLRHRG